MNFNGKEHRVLLPTEEPLDDSDVDLSDEEGVNPFATPIGKRETFKRAWRQSSKFSLLYYVLLLVLAVGVGVALGFFLGVSITYEHKDSDFDSEETDPNSVHGPNNGETDAGHNGAVIHDGMLTAVSTQPPTVRPTVFVPSPTVPPTIKPNPTQLPTTLQPTIGQSVGLNAIKKLADELPDTMLLTTTLPFTENDNDAHSESDIAKLLKSSANAITVGLQLENFALSAPLVGPRTVEVMHPKQSGGHYADNARMEWCISVAVRGSAIASAQVDVVFQRLDLEQGFDRLVVEAHNHTEQRVGHSFTGTRTPQPMHWWVAAGSALSICVRLMTDADTTATGLHFAWNVRVDPCEYGHLYDDTDNVDDNVLPSIQNHFLDNFQQRVKDNWDATEVRTDAHCHTTNCVNQVWGRGPFYDGKCGIGVKGYTKTGEYQSEFNALFAESAEENGNGNATENLLAYVRCEKARDKAVGKGPFYCKKRDCQNIDNYRSANLPSSVRYGWGQINKTFNGALRWDPHWADVFTVFKAYDAKRKADEFPAIAELLSNLKAKLKEIVTEQSDERVLSRAFVPYAFSGKVLEHLGARVVHSLLIGRPFVYAFSGSSNTAGHDNMYASAYALQLQSRLRKLWVQIGANGAAFVVRNAAIGGPTNTKSHALWSHVVVTSNYDYWSLEEEKGTGKLAVKKPTDLVDVLTWESSMNDGGGNPKEWFEMHARTAAALNAIWNRIFIHDYCYSHDGKEVNYKYKWNSDALEDNSMPVTKESSYRGAVVDYRYGVNDSIAVMEHNFAKGIGGACDDRSRYWWSKNNWHPSPVGHRIDALNLAYDLLRSGVSFLERFKPELETLAPENIVTAQMRTFLEEKSGRFADAYYSMDGSFPKPLLCSPYCQTLPFVLVSHRPEIWNMAFKLRDYVLSAPKTGHWTDYWKLLPCDNEQKEWLDEMDGGQGSIDRKFAYAPAFDEIQAAVGAETNLSTVSGAMEVVTGGFSFDVAMKFPRNGNGTLQVVTGISSNNVKQSYHLFVAALNPNAEVNAWWKQQSVSDRCEEPQYKGIGCVVSGFSPGGKYKMQFVPKRKLDKADLGLSIIAGL